MSRLLELGRLGQPLPVAGITDMHGHLGRYAFAIPDLTPASVVRGMDRLGVARTVCSHMRCMSADIVRGNREVWAAMREFPGRILGYASVWPASARQVRDEVRWAVDHGFVGLKLHNANGFSYQAPAYEPAYAVANERHWPVLFHTWGEAKVLDEVRALARQYPDAVFLTAHAGCGNEEGYVQLARDCANVYLDPCLSRAPRGLFDRFAAAVGADRIVWGSDVLFLSQAQQLGRILGARISDADKRLILATNAGRMLARVKA